MSKNVGKPLSITISGPTHSGKTHLALVIMKALHAAGYEEVNLITDQSSQSVIDRLRDPTYWDRTKNEYNTYQAPITIYEGPVFAAPEIVERLRSECRMNSEPVDNFGSKTTLFNPPTKTVNEPLRFTEEDWKYAEVMIGLKNEDVTPRTTDGENVAEKAFAGLPCQQFREVKPVEDNRDRDYLNVHPVKDPHASIATQPPEIRCLNAKKLIVNPEPIDWNKVSRGLSARDGMGPVIEDKPVAKLQNSGISGKHIDPVEPMYQKNLHSNLSFSSDPNQIWDRIEESVAGSRQEEPDTRPSDVN